MSAKITLPTAETSISINWSKMTLTIPTGVKVIKVLVEAMADESGGEAWEDFSITHPDSGRTITTSASAAEGYDSIVNYIKVIPGMVYKISDDYGLDGNDVGTNVVIYYSTSINEIQTSNDLTY